MPVLKNPQHEQFAVNYASGLNCGNGKQSAIAAGYATTAASDVTASRLLKNDKIASRIEELRLAANRSHAHHAIVDREIRIGDYDLIRSKLLQVMAERAAHPDFAEAPGGKTGTLVKTFKQVGSGRDATLIEEFAVDTGLLGMIHANNKQAAIELSQWSEKREVSGELSISMIDSWLNDDSESDSPA